MFASYLLLLLCLIQLCTSEESLKQGRGWGSAIKWATSLDEAYQRARKESKPILVIPACACLS